MSALVLVQSVRRAGRGKGHRRGGSANLNVVGEEGAGWVGHSPL